MYSITCQGRHAYEYTCMHSGGGPIYRCTCTRTSCTRTSCTRTRTHARAHAHAHMQVACAHARAHVRVRVCVYVPADGAPRSGRSPSATAGCAGRPHSPGRSPASPVKSNRGRSNQVTSRHVTSSQIEAGQTKSRQATSSQVTSGQVCRIHLDEARRDRRR